MAKKAEGKPEKLLELLAQKKLKAFDLTQPLGIHTHFWPYYPPFEMKYFKRKSEHGVNAQIITSSWHIGTHLDAPRHFLTRGETIDQIPLSWTVGAGVIVDLADEMDDLGIYTPKMIEERADVRAGDILILHTGWHKYAAYGKEPDEERYILYHPGAHPDMVDWLVKKHIHIWGVDAVSTDHPMDLPIGRFLGKGTFGQCERVRAFAEKKYGKATVDRLFPVEDYQLTHNKLFSKGCIHLENLGGQISDPKLQNRRVLINCAPIKIEGAESAWTRVLAFLTE
jgi:kynurenine formamidase